MGKRTIFTASKYLLAVTMFLILSGSTAFAATQDEILKSINKNVGESADMSKVIPFVLGGLGLIIMAVLYNQRRQRIGPRSKVLNNRNKLLREIARTIHLKNSEIRQLKILAEEREVSSPLTLLICPSILAKAMRTQNPRIDRKVLAQLVRRLREEQVAEDAASR